MTKKAHPEKTFPELVVIAKQNAKGRGDAWTEYIIAHYHATGNLAPGCDARDFYAAYDALMAALDNLTNAEASL